MLAVERQRKIRQALLQSGSVRTKELARRLSVTDETIRKDFEFLEQQGVLVRSHGGAIWPQGFVPELSLTERQSIHREAKNLIAKAAAKRVRANETIFIDASSTALTITQFLPELPISVITNSHDVVSALAGAEHIDLLCTGGLFEPRSRSYLGTVAEKALLRYHINRMFFSGNGLDLARGVSERNSRQAAFKEHVIAAAEDVCLMADASKIGEKSAFFFADCSQLTSLITNENADSPILESLRNIGVETVVV